jgi:hypothetical protein
MVHSKFEWTSYVDSSVYGKKLIVNPVKSMREKKPKHKLAPPPSIMCARQNTRKWGHRVRDGLEWSQVRRERVPVVEKVVIDEGSKRDKLFLGAMGHRVR